MNVPVFGITERACVWYHGPKSTTYSSGREKLALAPTLLLPETSRGSKEKEINVL